MAGAVLGPFVGLLMALGCGSESEPCTSSQKAFLLGGIWFASWLYAAFVLAVGYVVLLLSDVDSVLQDIREAIEATYDEMSESRAA
jgi:hypothetical protein